VFLTAVNELSFSQLSLNSLPNLKTLAFFVPWQRFLPISLLKNDEKAGQALPLKDHLLSLGLSCENKEQIN
jgi:hypothetical protein